MNVTCNTQALAVELRLLCKVVPNKPTIAILGYVLITARDQLLTLQATDLELGLRTSCAAQVHAPGDIALPAAKLLAIVEQLPDQDITLSLDVIHVRIASGAFKSRLQAMTAKDFPRLPEPEGTASEIDGTELCNLIGRTRYAINAASSKVVLQGALLTFAGQVAAMVSTDSKRLALATAGRSGADARVLIPAKTLDMIASQAADGMVEVTVGDRHLFFSAGDRLLTSRAIDGQYPEYQRIIPKSSDVDKKVTVDRLRLAAALRRVGLVSETNYACYLAFEGTMLTLSAASAEVGDATEQVAVAYDGPPIKVCCNWQYVLDFLDAASGQTVTLELKDDKSPMLLTDGPSHIAVIMLMRS